MKKTLLIGLGLALYSVTASSQFSVTNLNLPVEHADISVMDWDNDNDLDLIISGEHPVTLAAFLNDGTGNYTPANVPFSPVTRSAFDWNDVNMDGLPDFIESGFRGAAYTSIFNSDGVGGFTQNPVSLPQMAPTSGFADFNNDGYIDVYVFGNNDQGKSKILLSDKAGGFTDAHAFDTYFFKFDPDVSVVDYDNDKDMDIFINVSQTENGSKFARLFQNNNAVFTEVQTFLPEMGYGSSVWGDYDGDGFLDLLCNGLNTGDTDFKYQLFKNNAGASFTLVNSYSYNQLSTGDGGRFFDFDNDGDLDFVVTGYTGTREATAVYINTLGVFTEYAGNATLPGFAASSIEVGDVDNDTDLDLFLTGFSANDFDGALTTGPYNNKTSLLLKNLTAVVNVAPAAPTNLSVTGNQSALTITWNAATDLSPFQPANSLSYNLFVVDAAGKWFYYPLADTATGKLRLQRLGNVNLNKGWIIKGLPAGTYRCGVQAIDNSFMGSPFAKTTFTITEQGTLPVVLSAFLVKTEGKKAKIEWNTATEQNNDYFEIERSANGTDFYKLAAVKGSGNANNANSYSVYDNNPSKGKNYYRLIQYNKDGRITNHGVRTAIFDLNSLASVVLYPNPARNVFGIRLSNYESKLLNITVTDLSGKVVHRELLKTDNGQGYYNLNMKRKPASGQYILRVDGQDLKQSLKMIVQ